MCVVASPRVSLCLCCWRCRVLCFFVVVVVVVVASCLFACALFVYRGVRSVFFFLLLALDRVGVSFNRVKRACQRRVHDRRSSRQKKKNTRNEQENDSDKKGARDNEAAAVGWFSWLLKTWSQKTTIVGCI